MKFIQIPNRFLFILIYIVIFLKISLFFYLREDFQKIPSDANYYHEYALGYLDTAVNIWPVILNYLNINGIYDRDSVSDVLLFLNVFFIPFFALRAANLNFNKNQYYSLLLVILLLVFPTLYFYTFDVYRDVFMVFSFLVSCLIVKKFISSSNFFYKFFLIFLIFLMGFFLFKLRAYLGYAFLGAFFLYKLKFTKKRILYFSFIYILLLFLANYFGLFDSLTEYRSGFNENLGGSTLGLDFSNPVMFVPNFILSTLGQLFGLYIVNSTAILLFILETLPFIFMLFYIVKNIRYTDGFSRFLIIFFILYASVWLIGNDNLGTAVRLRIYNYFAIYICFFYILSLKNKLQFKRESIK